ncbi:MAG: hypothetical protein MUF84_06170 [Anaerolineae bacterium]|nr:hypothetical protein [Anaerolineae bacterium]
MRILVVLFLSGLLLAGCTEATIVPPEPMASVSPLLTEISPISTVVTLGAPDEFTPPAPAEGRAIITGRLGVENTRQPMAGIEVYLGDHIGSTDDTPLYGFDPGVAPRTVVGDDGRFVFPDVLPGRYVLIIWNAVSPMLARDADLGTPLDITVEAGQTTDLGLLLEPMQ